jgi:uncharacterized membrane protein YtjA (UPF0391 family)
MSWNAIMTRSELGVRAGFYWEKAMLRLAILFLVIALVSILLGFTGVAGLSMEAARIIFFVFLVLFVVSLILGRRSPGNVV